MTTQEYLRQIKRYDIEIDRLIAEINRNYDRAMSISVKVKEIDVQTSGSQDPMGDSIVKVSELNKELELAIKNREKIVAQVKCIKNNTYYEILVKRYIMCKPWKVIEIEMDRTHRYMMSLHKEALDDFECKFGSIYCEKIA